MRSIIIILALSLPLPALAAAQVQTVMTTAEGCHLDAHFDDGTLAVTSFVLACPNGSTQAAAAAADQSNGTASASQTVCATAICNHSFVPPNVVTVTAITGGWQVNAKALSMSHNGP